MALISRDKAVRRCPVCRSENHRFLFRQQFGVLSEGSLLSGYDIVICLACGASYADGIPSREAFDRYYAEMSKYEYSDRAGTQNASDLRRFGEVADLVAPHLRSSEKLLDIGCATGGLLAEFKRRGFHNLLGIDPSPSCAHITEDLHRIPSRSLTIAQIHHLDQQFDIIFLTGVLEHLPDIDFSLRKIAPCLRAGGLIYIEVPDATRYDQHCSAPFQFFSVEHVNFFSPLALSNLLSRHDFKPVSGQKFIRHLGPKTIEPTVGGLFCRRPRPSSNVLAHDDETEPALNRYILQSRKLEQRIHNKINAMVNSARPIAVWGTGTHTLRLLETSRLKDARIVAFIDSNAHYQGKTLVGLPIIAPAMFSDAAADVLISSQTAEEEIFQLITHTLRWPNAVHRLYS